MSMTAAIGNPPVHAQPCFSALIRHLLPAWTWVECGNAARDARGVWPKVALIDGASMAHQESLDARDPVFGRDGDDAEATDHPLAHDIVHGAARGGRTLGLQDPKEIAVEWPRLVIRGAASALSAGA